MAKNNQKQPNTQENNNNQTYEENGVEINFSK